MPRMRHAHSSGGAIMKRRILLSAMVLIGTASRNSEPHGCALSKDELIRQLSEAEEARKTGGGMTEHLVEVAVINDPDLLEVSTRLRTLLRSHGIEPYISGTMGYSVRVESAVAHKAAELIRNDEQLRSRGIQLGNR